MIVQVDCTCPICNKTTPVFVDEKDYFDWKDGALAQNVFWYLDANEREMLISGICPECWENMFGSSEDEEEDEDDPDYDYDYDYDEVGFNPYMGCYDFDC